MLHTVYVTFTASLEARWRALSPTTSLSQSVLRTRQVARLGTPKAFADRATPSYRRFGKSVNSPRPCPRTCLATQSVTLSPLRGLRQDTPRYGRGRGQSRIPRGIHTGTERGLDQTDCLIDTSLAPKYPIRAAAHCERQAHHASPCIHIPRRRHGTPRPTKRAPRREKRPCRHSSRERLPSWVAPGAHTATARTTTRPANPSPRDTLTPESSRVRRLRAARVPVKICVAATCCCCRRAAAAAAARRAAGVSRAVPAAARATHALRASARRAGGP